MDSQIVQFTNFSKKESLLKRIYFINGIIVLFMTFVLAALFDLFFHEGGVWNFNKDDILFFSLWAMAAIVALLIFFMDRKTIGNFLVSENGIQAGTMLYSWQTMRHYHWLGEAQEERVGIIGVGRLFHY